MKMKRPTLPPTAEDGARMARTCARRARHEAEIARFTGNCTRLARERDAARHGDERLTYARTLRDVIGGFLGTHPGLWREPHRCPTTLARIRDDAKAGGWLAAWDERMAAMPAAAL